MGRARTFVESKPDSFLHALSPTWVRVRVGVRVRVRVRVEVAALPTVGVAVLDDVRVAHLALEDLLELHDAVPG